MSEERRFLGTSADYVRHRPPYPAALIRDLLERSRVPKDGFVLDLGCGPGLLSLPLAPHVREVWAVDPEPEMIAEGRAQAAAKGAGNIRWIPGRAEDVEVPAATVDLVTIGAAFHWMDQARVAGRVLEMLKPGGCFVTAGYDGLLGEDEGWQRIVAQIVRKWNPALDQSPPRRLGGPGRDEAVMRQFGFEDVATHSFSEPGERTLEGILGLLRSTSVCSRRRLGAQAAEFEAALRAQLLAHDPRGLYRENFRFGYTLGRKTASPA